MAFCLLLLPLSFLDNRLCSFFSFCCDFEKYLPFGYFTPSLVIMRSVNPISKPTVLLALVGLGIVLPLSMRMDTKYWFLYIETVACFSTVFFGISLWSFTLIPSLVNFGR